MQPGIIKRFGAARPGPEERSCSVMAKSHLIYPGNVSSANYIRNYHRPVSRKLGMITAAVYIGDPTRSSDGHDVGAAVNSKLAHWSGVFARAVNQLYHEDELIRSLLRPEDTDMFLIDVSAGRLHPALRELLPPIHFENAVDGIFPVCSYWDADQKGYPLSPVGAVEGTLLLDSWIVSTGTTDPQCHQPFEVSEQQAAVYGGVIGEAFGSGKGVWCEEVVNARAIGQVMLQAIMRNCDPRVEIRRLLDVDNKQ